MTGVEEVDSMFRMGAVGLLIEKLVFGVTARNLPAPA